MKCVLLPCLVLLSWMPAIVCCGQSREEKVRSDRRRVEAEGFWLYNDLDKAYETAQQSGKPIVVCLRCLPCEECVKIDDELIDNDPTVRPLLEKFVCVRIVGTNGLDLDTFQYDTDQSFAMFMLGPDKTIYGRFGTRSDRTQWQGDVSIKGLAAALSAALKLHADASTQKTLLAAKRGKPLEFASPEKYPSLKSKYTNRLNYEGDVVKSCIHCHQIGDARREYYWSQQKPIIEELLFPYPHPKSIGLVLDPDFCARVKQIAAGSIAEKSGLKAGDDLVTLDQQPLISMADVQWVLHHTPNKACQLPVTVNRDGQTLNLTLDLPAGWRRLDDPHWRVSSWGLCRMMLGGMRLESMTKEQRDQAGVDGPMALKVRSVGRYGAHAVAMRAGMKPDDIIVSYDGQHGFDREADLFAYAAENLKTGNKVTIEYLRNGKRRTVTLPIQQ